MKLPMAESVFGIQQLMTMIVWIKVVGSGEKKKRSLPSWDTANNESAIKRRRQQKNLFANDLSDVTPRFPIPKSSGRVNEGSSKYPGVHFDNQINKWAAYISIKWGAKNYWSLW